MQSMYSTAPADWATGVIVPIRILSMGKKKNYLIIALMFETT